MMKFCRSLLIFNFKNECLFWFDWKTVKAEILSEQEKHSANQETENWANFIQNINNLWSEMQKLSNFSEQE